jgi:hypothetical protein
MDKRGFGAIGAIVVMVIAGLIVYGIIYYGPNIWQGIRGGVAGVGGTSIKDIMLNPETYENKEVVVVGTSAGMGVMSDDGYFLVYYQDYSSAQTPQDKANSNAFIINAGWKCKITGTIVRVKEFMGVLVPTGSYMENYATTSWWLRVTEISRI